MRVTPYITKKTLSIFTICAALLVVALYWFLDLSFCFFIPLIFIILAVHIYAIRLVDVKERRLSIKKLAMSAVFDILVVITKVSMLTFLVIYAFNYLIPGAIAGAIVIFIISLIVRRKWQL